jgi:hypothetical protein
MMRQVSPAQKIPREIQRIAAENRLGRPRLLCKSVKETGLYRLIGPGIMIVGCLIVGAFLLAYATVFQGWPLWQVALIPLVGVGWLIVGVWITLASFLTPWLRVYLCAHGLICTRREAEIIRWEQIERIWKHAGVDGRGHILRSCSLRLSDGTMFLFPGDLLHIEQLSALLENEVTRLRLPQAITAYYSGVPLIFGPVVVSAHGIGMKRGRSILAWDEVGDIKLDEMTLAIYKKGEARAWALVKVAGVPNVGVFQSLIARVKQELARNCLPHIVAYKAGFPVSFGSLSISRQGVMLDNGKISLSWNEIAGIAVGEREVMVRKKNAPDEWYALPLWMVPDVAMLKELLDYVMHGHLR